VREIVDRYVRLLQVAAGHPELPIGKLVGMTGPSRLGLKARLQTVLSAFARWSAG
jgi:hypothetical protein